MFKKLARLKPYRVEIFLLLLALLPHLFIALSNNNTMLDWYSSDDGFYYFQVARNLAAGHSFTFDGINLTNGFHPLWLFVITPIFFFTRFDPLLPLRILVLVSALLSAGSAILLYRILRRYAAEGVATFMALLWLVIPRIHDITLHAGVEAGLSAFCLLLFWNELVGFAPQKNNKQRLQQLAGLGVLAALAVLSRLDNIFIIAFGGLWLLLRLWKPANKQKQWPWRISNGIAFFGPITLIMLIYLAWNQLTFGTLMPVSGEVKLWWGTLRNTVYGFPVRHLAAFAGQFVTNDPELGPWSLLTAPLYAGADALLSLLGASLALSTRRYALIGLGLLLTALGTFIVWKQRPFISKAVPSVGLIPLFLGCFVQIVYYKVSGSVAQQPWYWVAEMIWLLLALGILLNAVWLWLAPRLQKRRDYWGRSLSIVVFGALSIYFLVFIGSAIRSPGDGSNHFYLDRARWLEAHTQPGARIAITGAGNLAYFIQDRTIVNMDGLMNSHQYFLAMKAGQGAEFLADEGVDYVFGNEYIYTQTNPYEPMLEGHLQPYAIYTFADRQLPLWRFVP